MARDLKGGFPVRDICPSRSARGVPAAWFPARQEHRGMEARPRPTELRAEALPCDYARLPGARSPSSLSP